MFKNLLVITDQNLKSNLALQKAFDIAAPFNAKVTVLSFITAKQVSEDSALLKQLQADLKTKLVDIFTDINVTSEVLVTDNIPATVTQQCASRKIDLVIKTGHRSEKLFYTPLDWQLIRELKCPILLASEKKWRKSSTVLAAVDVSNDDAIQHELNQRVLTWANSWAERTNKSLSTCYAIKASKVLEDMDITSADKIVATKKPKAEKNIGTLLTATKAKCDEIHVALGKPEKIIPSYANKIKAELVVIGSVGRKGLKGLLLGNTAERVLQHLYTDVLIIRPN